MEREERGKTAANSDSRVEVDVGVGKRLNRRPLGMCRAGEVWERKQCPGFCESFGVRGGDGVGVVGLWGVFSWRGGHKPHEKVAGKGNALILSRVNKGREERGIYSL